MSETTQKNSALSKLTPQRRMVYENVLKNLESGTGLWERGWKVTGVPESAATGKEYRGINQFLLTMTAMIEGYSDNRWVTFHQMKEHEWHFKTDEEGKSLAKNKGVTVEFYELRDRETKKRFDRSVLSGMTKDERDEYMDKNVYPLRKYYCVFNGDLIDGIPVREETPLDEKAKSERAESFIDFWSEKESKIIYGGSESFYRVKSDEIYLPKKEDFHSLADYYSTALHEIGHATGHEKRLNRKLSNQFGSSEYAAEELRAEIASMFMEQDFKVDVEESKSVNNSAYIGAWLKEIKEDPDALFKAIIDADKIAKYVLSKDKEREKGVENDAIGTDVHTYEEEVMEEKSDEYIKPSEIAARAVVNQKPIDMSERGERMLTRMFDREVIEKAEKVKTGDTFRKLYEGEKVFESEGKDEQILMMRLAMFCEDREQTLRIFKTSGQFRDHKPNSYYLKMAGEAMKTMARENQYSTQVAPITNGSKVGSGENVKA